MFLPRKPSPNGMLIWTVATFVEHPVKTKQKIPYFVQFIPHLKPNDGGTTFATQVFMRNWSAEMKKPHIVADAGFGSFQLMEEITKWGGTATMSIATNECKQLDVLMGWNLPKDHWRACINGNGVIFSIQKIEVENGSGGASLAKKMVISNAFTAQPLPTIISVSGE